MLSNTYRIHAEYSSIVFLDWHLIVVDSSPPHHGDELEGVVPGEEGAEDVLVLGGGQAHGVRYDLGRLLLAHLQHGPYRDLELEQRKKEKKK